MRHCHRAAAIPLDPAPAQSRPVNDQSLRVNTRAFSFPLSSVSGKKGVMYCVFNKTAESFLGLNVSCACTRWARLKGAVRNLRLGSDQGLWVIPSRGIHSLGALVPIDVIYLDADGRVIDLVEHASPFRLTPIRWKSRSILQLPTHTIYATNTKIGDELLICAPQEMETYLGNSTSKSGQQKTSA
jgi:uncharacterized membrane protein (UPF0127 family)